MNFRDSRELVAQKYRIEPTPINLRRIGNGMDIADNGQVEYKGNDSVYEVYEVKSQRTNEKLPTAYTVKVLPGSIYPKCECPDYHEPGRIPIPEGVVNLHRCKHGIATLLTIDRGRTSLPPQALFGGENNG